MLSARLNALNKHNHHASMKNLELNPPQTNNYIMGASASQRAFNNSVNLGDTARGDGNVKLPKATVNN